MILFRGARVWAPDDLGVCDLLVAGDTIAAVARDLPLPPVGWPCEVVDAAGLWLLPGLIDAHTHLGGGGGEGGAETRVPPVALTQLTLAGVTTAVGLLGTDGTTRSLADLLAVARGLSALGVDAYCYTGSYEVPPVTLTGSVRGDIVHLDRVVAAGEVAISDHRSSQPTFDELVRIAADCHVAGLMTRKAGLLHLHLGDGPRGLALVRRALDETELPPRVFHPTHVNRNPRLWDEALATSDRGVPIDITAFPDDDDDPAVPAATALAAYFTAGKDPRRVTLSSDGGGCLPTFDAAGNLLKMDVGSSGTLLPTLRRAIAAGTPTPLAIAAATANVADLFRFARKGRLVVGAQADLLLVDPALAVSSVVARGRFLVREGRAVARGLFGA